MDVCLGGVHTCQYRYVYVCICMYMPVSEIIPVSKSLQTDIGWNAYKHLLVCICMYHMYKYLYGCIGMYLYVYVCMCIYVHLCCLYTINMLISACTCQATVAQWHTQPHMTVQTGVRTPKTTKAFCFRKDFLLLGIFF